MIGASAKTPESMTEHTGCFPFKDKFSIFKLYFKTPDFFIFLTRVKNINKQSILKIIDQS